MEKKKFVIEYEEYKPGEKLDDNDDALIHEANKAVACAYAPYSEFYVGAALKLDNGIVIKGSNQENSAYPAGLCAERVALFHAKSEYPNSIITSIAITSNTNRFETNEPITPCGSCRQVIAETEKRQNKKIRIIMSGKSTFTRVVNGIDSLLPMKFQEDKLKKRSK